MTQQVDRRRPSYDGGPGPDPLGAADADPRHDRRQRRAARDRYRPRLQRLPPSPGCSTPTRSPSAGCCCSAAGSATCSADAARSSPASPSSRSARCSAAWPPPRAAGGGPCAPGRRRRRRRAERAGAADQHRAGRRRARNRALGLFSAVCSAGGSIGLILGGALTGYASWRWSLFINVPIGAARAGPRCPRFVDETAAPRWPLRRDRRGDRDARLGQPGLRVHQRARPRLDLGRHGRRVRARRGAARRFRRQRAPRLRPRCSTWTCCAAGCARERSR